MNTEVLMEPLDAVAIITLVAQNWSMTYLFNHLPGKINRGVTTYPYADHIAVVSILKYTSTLFDHAFLEPGNVTILFGLFFKGGAFPSILKNQSTIIKSSMKFSSDSHHSTYEPSISYSVPTHFITCGALSVKIGRHCMNRLTQSHFNNPSNDT